MNIYDKIMYVFLTHLTGSIYHLILFAGPIEICRSFMLKNNKKIFGITICYLESLRCFCSGYFFDRFNFKSI